MKIQMFRKYIFLRCRTMNNGFLVSTDNINNNNPGSRVIVRILRIEMSYTGIIKDLFPEDTSSFVKDLIAISQWKCQLKRFHSVAHVTIYCAIRATILCYNVKRQVWLGFSFVFINRTSGNTIQKMDPSPISFTSVLITTKLRITLFRSLLLPNTQYQWFFFF